MKCESSGVRGSPSSVRTLSRGGANSGRDGLTPLSNAHSGDTISESEEAENEKGRLILPVGG